MGYKYLPSWMTAAGKRLPLPLLLVFSLLAWPPGALAEEAVEDDREEIEEIVVTGSRIKRSDFASASPITVITGQSVLESGFGNIGEALRNTAVAGTAGFNQSSVLSGGGATSVDLRNLGPDRVLILINGKRVASFADALANQAADLTFVPNAMVERVEILRDGASAVYGADAVSGVVNVILKDSFEGIEAGVSSGISGEGDAEQYSAEFAIGATGDRGSVVLGGEYRYSNNLPQTDRAWAFPAVSVLSGTAQHGSFFSPGGVFWGANGFYCTMPKAFGGDEVTNVFPNCPSFAPAQAVSHPDQVQLARYDYALGQDIWGASEVYTFAGYGTYDLTDAVREAAKPVPARRQPGKLARSGEQSEQSHGGAWHVLRAPDDDDRRPRQRSRVEHNPDGGGIAGRHRLRRVPERVELGTLSSLHPRRCRPHDGRCVEPRAREHHLGPRPMRLGPDLLGGGEPERCARRRAPGELDGRRDPVPEAG